MAGFMLSTNNMETIITISLVVIVVELYFVLDRLQLIHGSLERIWHGLGGLGKLDYLQYIDTKLENLDSLGRLKKISEKVEEIADTTDVIKDEINHKD
jgi:uncharacterized protein YoxC